MPLSLGEACKRKAWGLKVPSSTGPRGVQGNRGSRHRLACLCQGRQERRGRHSSLEGTMSGILRDFKPILRVRVTGREGTEVGKA